MKRKWAAPLAFWTAALAVAIALGAYAKPPTIPGMPAGRMLPRVPSLPPNLPELLFMLGVGSVIWYAAIVSIPLLLLVARRIHPERHNRARLIAAGILIFAILFLVTATVEYLVIYGTAGMAPPITAYFAVALRQHLLAWIAVAAIVGAVEAGRRTVQSRLEKQQLRAQVAEQRLIALTGQLQPHFLFNTLQGISTLIYRDPDAADEMLSKLSDLLRDLLKHREGALVKVEEELRYVRTYLEISKVRFADRLSFSIDADADVMHTRIPLFILQPLVENALNHGIGSRAQGGVISVRALKEAQQLVLEVEDDGGGLSNRNGDGIGLSNTRERLVAMYGASQKFEIKQNETGGVTTRIEVPAR